MDTNTLQAFVAVSETGSFSLAAEKLFLTQPAVSKRVAALEDEVETKLFERLGKKVLLTEAGIRLLPRAKKILFELADSKRMIADLSNDVCGTLQIGISHHVGLHRLPDILRVYRQQFPKVEFDLHFMDSEEGCSAVSAGDIELAVVTLPEKTVQQLNITPIWRDSLQLMVPRDHWLINCGKDITLLQEAPAILPERGTITRELIDQGLKEQNLKLTIGVETNYLETIRMLVSAGLGWSVLPLSMLNEELETIEISGLTFMRELGLVTHKNRTLSSAARAFSELLLAAKE